MDIKAQSKKMNFEIKRIKESGFFDSDWYLKRYPDVKISNLDPAYHYLKYGALLGRDPSPDFSTEFYFDIKPWVRKKQINPLLHFLSNSKQENSDASIVLKSADKIASNGQWQLAERLAHEFFPPGSEKYFSILKANVAALQLDYSRWLLNINKYLSEYNVSPLFLMPDESFSLISRLYCKDLTCVSGGDLVSIIMPVWNSESTVYYAAMSILQQTYKNIELIVIDDCSSDGTWSELERLKKVDERVKIIRNKINVGPYVSKNIALSHVNGKWVTGHDGDDWAHPQRIEKHIKFISENEIKPKASVMNMLRISPSGKITQIGRQSSFSPDGVSRIASISCIFDKDFLVNRLGGWDAVRFGADSELIERAKIVLKNNFLKFNCIGMLCLDLEHSLTNDPVHGIYANEGKVSKTRAQYKESWMQWHNKIEKGEVDCFYLDSTLEKRAFWAPQSMCVGVEDARLNFTSAGVEL